MREGRTATEFEIVVDHENLTVHWRTIENKEGWDSFQWRSVLMVEAFKRDLWTVDCICLAFQTPEGWHEVNEGMKGWNELLMSIEKMLNGFPKFEEWFISTGFPPFATNRMTLWRRPV